MRERGTEWGEWVKVVWAHVALEVGGLQAKNPSLLHSSSHASGSRSISAQRKAPYRSVAAMANDMSSVQ